MVLAVAHPNPWSSASFYLPSRQRYFSSSANSYSFRSPVQQLIWSPPVLQAATSHLITFFNHRLPVRGSVALDILMQSMLVVNAPWPLRQSYRRASMVQQLLGR